ncbi:adenylyl cyclase-associated protein [Plakobranchus ocellatus]|uniref:Adenylyl cyclase-associated protein n=1 Tax=Plakobranchus ocellatus TaxID=259542 RepID=A0AAV4AB39_9GAST|nr:adenylyl cyclase-associated protein [Plakobranchus ocellatus]
MVPLRDVKTMRETWLLLLSRASPGSPRNENTRGGDAKSVASSGASAAAAPPAGGAPPPPPPPGPPPPPPPASSGGASDDNSRAALFAELSKGEKVTQGLRKVTDDMKTHKNPALRQGPAPFKSTQPKPASPKPAPKPVAAPVKPPLIELQGKKWVVEYHKNNREIVVDKTELKQSLYVFKCEGCVIQVKGKINSIILDSCKKTAIVFDSLLASLEFVNCQSMQAQVNGKLPTVSIDKTDGCMVYLSNESLDVEVVTAKSSEMNILVPQGDGDFKEFALPEQFKTKYDGKTMVTTIAESL